MLAVVGLAGPAASAGPASSTPSSANLVDGFAGLGLSGDSYKITLVTGDVVTLTAAGRGRYTVTVEQARRQDGSVPSVEVTGSGDKLFALPEDVRPFITSGRVDKELFNLGYLAANGYGDRVRGSLPVILEYTERLSTSVELQRAEALPASDVTYALESIDAAALTVRKSNAEAFWASLRGDASVGASTESLENGVTKVWLDRKVQVDLSESVPQIGAPQAWAAGYDGSGVKVAVLDTGIDETHPDVTGKVIASKSFISGQAVADGHGHGTHVAATIAGSGAAQAGTYRGVAPGARLLIAKVLGNSGSGRTSEIIKGMEWATREQGAKVVSMSLGSSPTAGTDVASQAVNRLTRDTGALFVIAAGNSGAASGTVEAPGAADAALTVAAVDKSDQLANFSSRGPRVGDSALKPDIAAPGVAIVAARAAGTSMGKPVNDRYTSANGTSMATPHVAGAAAILAQQHPGWAPDELKAALISTSKDDGYTVYEQGGGRVDVARAVSQEVFATTANIDFKFIAFDDKDNPITKTLTYTNLSSETVTLNLTAAANTIGGPLVPDDALTANAAALTVPAGGSAQTTVTLKPIHLGHGQFTGAIVATGPDGIRLRTPVGFAIGLQQHTLVVTVDERNISGSSRTFMCVPVWVTHCGHLSLEGVAGEAEGVERHGDALGVCVEGDFADPQNPCRRRKYEFEVPAGTYSVATQLLWKDVDDPQRDQYGWLINPQFTVTGDTEVSLDADDLEKLKVVVPQSSETFAANLGYTRWSASGVGSATVTFVGWGALDQLWASRTAAVTTGKFLFWSQWALGAPMVTMAVQQPKRIELNPMYASPLQGEAVRFPAGTRTIPLVDAGMGSADDFAGISARGKLVLLRGAIPWEGDWLCGLEPEQLKRAAQAGAVGVLVRGVREGCGLPFRANGETADLPRDIPFVSITDVDAAALLDLLERGAVKITVQGTPVSPYMHRLKLYEDGRIPNSLRYGLTFRDLVLIDAHYHSEGQVLLNHTSARWRTDEFFIAGLGTYIEAPSSRREYFNPVPDAVHSRQFNSLHPDVFADPNAVLPLELFRTENTRDIFGKPIRREEHWNARPISVGAPTLSTGWVGSVGPEFAVCSGCRQGNKFYPRMYLTPAEESNAGAEVGLVGDELHLYRDGQEIPQGTPLADRVAYVLPQEVARYRLTLGRTRWTPDVLGQEMQTNWDFTSAAVTRDETPGGYPCLETALGGTTPCRAEPLIFLRYDAGVVSLDNTVRAGRSDKIYVTAYHQSATAPRINGLRLWLSFDDGANWEQAKVKLRGDGEFEAGVKYPKLTQTSGAVSLKAEAWDAGGNRVEQTIERAYLLRDGKDED